MSRRTAVRTSGCWQARLEKSGESSVDLDFSPLASARHQGLNVRDASFFYGRPNPRPNRRVRSAAAIRAWLPYEQVSRPER